MLLDLPTLFTARVSCAALAAAVLGMLAGAPAAHAESAGSDFFQVNTATDGGQEDPDVSDAASGFVIVWESDAEVHEVILGQRYADDGTRVGDNFPVSVGDESQIDPAVARADDFVVVWQNTDGNDIWGQRFNAEGAKVDDPFLVNTHLDDEQELAAIASDSAGNFVVVYESFKWGENGDGDEIVGQRFTSAGVRQDFEFLVNSTRDDDQQDPAVGRQPGGAFLVAWESDDGTGIGENSGIFAQRFDAAGDKQDPEFRVNPVVDGNQESPDVGAWSGGYVVVWVGPDGESNGIWARLYNSIGEHQTDQILVNTFQDADQRHPAVSVFDGGEFVVVWEDDDLGSQAREFDAAGVGLAKQFDISPSDKMQEWPRVQVQEGGYVATWFGAGAEADNDVFGKVCVSGDECAVPEPGSALLGLAALSTLAVLARTRRSRS